MIAIERGEDEGFIVSPICRLVFRRDGERWSHHIESSVTSGCVAESLESDLGLDDPTRVVSPCFQELHFQDSREGLALAMLVGQSGPHHFSAVFRMEMLAGIVQVEPPGEAEPICRITAELAVRSRAVLKALSSTYRVNNPGGQTQTAREMGMSWKSPLGILSLFAEMRPDPTGKTFLPVLTSTISAVRVDHAKYHAQIQAHIQPGESTHRYGYFWAFAAREPTDSP